MFYLKKAKIKSKTEFEIISEALYDSEDFNEIAEIQKIKNEENKEKGISYVITMDKEQLEKIKKLENPYEEKEKLIN